MVISTFAFDSEECTHSRGMRSIMTLKTARNWWLCPLASLAIAMSCHEFQFFVGATERKWKLFFL